MTKTRIEYRPCQHCGTRTCTEALFLVAKQKVCATCGAALIRETHKQVKET